MPSSEDAGSAIDYIIENRGKYPRAQIDAELLKVGHEPEVIEEWWIGVEEGISETGLERAGERELRNATRAWTIPILVRSYESNSRGEAAFAQEAAILARHQYEPSMQSAEGSHIHAGRLILTGGFSILAGRRGIRSKGKLTVTYKRNAEQWVTPVASPEIADPIEQIRKLAELRDAGILTVEEFEAKKADLLSRM